MTALKPFRTLVFLAAILIALCASAQGPGTLESGRSLLITGVTVYTAVGSPIKDGAVGIKADTIAFVGLASQVDRGAYSRVIERPGHHVYPAMIATNTTLGLTEIFAVRATRDFNEVGDYNPNVRALSAYNAESDVVGTVLTNGVAFAQICPRGGTISGTSSVVKLKGHNWTDASYRADEGIHVNWPQFYERKKGEDGKPAVFAADPKYTDKVRELRKFLIEARAYGQRVYPVERDLKLEALSGVFTGEKRLYVHANLVKEIREAIVLKRELEIPKVTIVGGADAHKVSDLLRENDISVLLRRVNSLPRFAEDPIDASYTAAGKLAATGVVFALQMEGGMETMQNRNLAFNAGTAIGHGLSAQDALKAVTIYPATILGIDVRTGSVEVGKEANLILTHGDMFDMRTGKVVEMYLQGKPIDLSNLQTDLYRQALRRYGLEEKP